MLTLIHILSKYHIITNHFIIDHKSDSSDKNRFSIYF